MTTVSAVVLLVAVLAFAVARPLGLSEAVVAVPAAALAVVLGLVPWPEALTELRDLAPTVAFLAAALLLSHLCDQAGVFRYAGAVAGRLSRGAPRRLLVLVFAIAALVTAVLSLDATVVLFTPVVLATAAALSLTPRPYVYACGHLANSASLLLPVSNLTNLLAVAASGIGFLRFLALMALPWAGVVVVEFVILRRYFAGDLAGSSPARPPAPSLARPPRFALATLGLTLVGFVVTGAFGLHPVWAAAAGAAVLLLAQRGGGRTTWAALSLPFCLFVLSLGVVVLAVGRSEAGVLVARLVPRHEGLVALLLLAGLAAVLANLVNNVPATLMLLPLVSHRVGPIMAVLLGVNIGPNVTYAGSLATLLWRRVLRGAGQSPRVGEFTRIGVLTVPACLTVGVAGLWLSLRL
ncbi:SLC13 family permease [Mangrovihabitans endophyticus]|uniref:SLC13 family permease n=1 Tax=Mangrovihabitans endophyticus TaxID=1751298 RepID=UPI00166C637C|nr:SLC13 family permease [Mangrovihabitans endophyticus]